MRSMLVRVSVWVRRGLALAALASIAGFPASGLAGPRRVVTSFYPMYVHTLNVAGGVEGVTVENLTEPIAGCLHDFQLTTVHMRRLSDADVLVVNGGGMENFIGKAVAQRPKLKIVEASRGIRFLKNEAGHHHGHDHDHDHGNGDLNEHVWVSPELAIQQVWNIAKALAAIDPERGDAYRANARAYADKLEALRKRMATELRPLSGKRVITFHEAFPYFAREFGLEVAAVVQREPGTEPSPRELARTIDLVKSSKVVAVFAEPQYPASGAQAIRRETGVEFGVLDPVVTGPEAPEKARDAYLEAMEKNLAALTRIVRTRSE